MGIFDFFRRKQVEPKQEERYYNTSLYGNASIIGNSSNQPISKERALQLSTVWSCVKVISETIASLPISLYEKDASNKRYILSDNPLHSLVGEQPSALYNSFDFFEKVLVDLCLDGNFYGYIERNNGGLPWLLYTSPRPRDKRQSRMPSSA